MLIPHDRFARKKGNSKYGKSEKAQRRREGEASGLPGQRLRPKAISEEIGYGLDRETVDFGSDNVNSFVREGKAFLVALGVRKIERRKARLAPPI